MISQSNRHFWWYAAYFVVSVILGIAAQPGSIYQPDFQNQLDVVMLAASLLAIMGIAWGRFVVRACQNTGFRWPARIIQGVFVLWLISGSIWILSKLLPV